ncbi:MAG: Holliday junction branch migration protein RuvA [Thermaerobacter sp.]|nr:Holliday junction branch migration protein RuvA [Thermaerobacter sp.]
MIVEIEGVVGEKRPGFVVIRTAQGLGYGVEVPRETEQKLPALGEKARLFTHLVVREDQWRLIGFESPVERQVFQDLLNVNGVGIKGALALLSHLGVNRLRQAVLTGDWKDLKGAPGVGAKIAQRVQLELMGRWLKASEVESRFQPPVQSAAAADEVALALVSLGYQASEAEAALSQVSAEQPEERLRQALKALDRGRAR